MLISVLPSNFSSICELVSSRFVQSDHENGTFASPELGIQPRGHGPIIAANELGQHICLRPHSNAIACPLMPITRVADISAVPLLSEDERTSGLRTGCDTMQHYL